MALSPQATAPPPARRTYSYLQVAEQLHRVLGERPTVNSLQQREPAERPTRGPGRITAAMPTPLNPGARAVRFDADAVDQWLVTHPRLIRQRLEELLRSRVSVQAHPDEQQLHEAIVTAHEGGLSWRVITAVVNEGRRPVGHQQIARQHGISLGAARARTGRG